MAEPPQIETTARGRSHERVRGDVIAITAPTTGESYQQGSAPRHSRSADHTRDRVSPLPRWRGPNSRQRQARIHRGNARPEARDSQPGRCWATQSSFTTHLRVAAGWHRR